VTAFEEFINENIAHKKAPTANVGAFFLSFLF